MINLYILKITDLPDPKDHEEWHVRFPEGKFENVLRFMGADDRKRSAGAWLLLSYALSNRGITDGPEGPVLVIADGNTGYGKRIWQREGHLVEDYAEISEGLSGDQANVIAETSVFEVERPAADRLIVTTDEGRTLITLRSEGGDGGE